MGGFSRGAPGRVLLMWEALAREPHREQSGGVYRRRRPAKTEQRASQVLAVKQQRWQKQGGREGARGAAAPRTPRFWRPVRQFVTAQCNPRAFGRGFVRKASVPRDVRCTHA